MAAECQKQGGTVVFIDAEHALDLSYAARIGVDTHKLLVSQPDSGRRGTRLGGVAGSVPCGEPVLAEGQRFAGRPAREAHPRGAGVITRLGGAVDSA